MNIKILSDIHLEFGGYTPGEGDVLVLAGDILVASELKRESPQGKYYRKFLKQCGKGYNKVFYVMGNHEHYMGNYDETAELIRAALPENAVLLENNSELYEGVHFVGATMWTNYNNNDPEAKLYALNHMNDFYSIEKGEVEQKLVPNDTLEAHNNTVEWLGQTLPTLKEGPVVVITHHAPSYTSLRGDYAEAVPHSYASNLTALIEEHKPAYWIHGHIHASNDYVIGETRVVSNPRGYANYQTNPDFEEISIDIVTTDKSEEGVQSV